MAPHLGKFSAIWEFGIMRYNFGNFTQFGMVGTNWPNLGQCGLNWDNLQFWDNFYGSIFETI